MLQKLSSTFVLLIGLLVIFQACEDPVKPAPPRFTISIIEGDQSIAYGEETLLTTNFINNSSDSIEYSWFVDDEEDFYENASTFSFSRVPDVTTSYKITVKAINDGVESEYSIHITVKGRPAFSGVITTTLTNLAYNESIFIDADYSNNRGFVSFKWYINDVEQVDEDYSFISFNPKPDVTTEYAIKVEINDTNTTVSDTIHITVQAPRPYTVTLAAPKTIIDSNETLLITAQVVNDKKISNGTYSWKINGVTTAKSTTDKLNFSDYVFEDTDFTISIEWNIDGQIVSDSINVSVRAAGRPYVEIRGNSFTHEYDTTRTYNNYIFNPKNKTISDRMWLINDVEDTSSNAGSSSYRFERRDVDVLTTFKLTFKCSIDGVEYSDSKDITVKPVPPPIIEFDTVIPASVQNNEIVTIKATGYYKGSSSSWWNPDIDWYVDDVLAASNTNKFTFKKSPDVETDYTIKCVYTTSDSKTAENSCEIKVLAPAPPILKLEGDITECAYDERRLFSIKGTFKGASISPACDWYIDDVLVLSSSNTYEFSQMPTSKTEYTLKVIYNSPFGPITLSQLITVGKHINGVEDLYYEVYSWEGHIDIIWRPTRNAVSYNIYSYDSLNKSYTLLQNTTETNIQFIPPQMDKKYGISVRAVADDGSLSMPSSYKYAAAHTAINASVIDWYQYKSEYNNVSLVGLVENTDTAGYTYAKVLIRFKDASGAIFVQKEERIRSGHLISGQKSGFKLLLSDYEKTTVRSYDFCVISDGEANLDVPQFTVNRIYTETYGAGAGVFYKYTLAEITNTGTTPFSSDFDIAFFARNGKVIDIVSPRTKTNGIYTSKEILPGETFITGCFMDDKQHWSHVPDKTLLLPSGY